MYIIQEAPRKTKEGRQDLRSSPRKEHLPGVMTPGPAGEERPPPAASGSSASGEEKAVGGRRGTQEDQGGKARTCAWCNDTRACGGRAAPSSRVRELRFRGGEGGRRVEIISNSF
ncbi:uncharacterized protein LOC143844309 [Paroedura picta]|uniref:uncharacterized protein LOC143844309 n=1 Tax=Paroedura picta TaxID=143630 RepID=UPI004055CC69